MNNSQDLSTLNLKENNESVTFSVKVQPRASRNAVIGMVGDSLKLCLTSPPVDGEANEACVRYFAELFKVSKGSVAIVSGHKGRNKLIEVRGLTKESFLSILKCEITS